MNYFKYQVKTALCILFAILIFGKVSANIGFTQEGFATYYGDYFHGKRTASGEVYNKNAHSAAHRTLPFGSIVKVTNTSNGKFTIVKINDRGPFGGGGRIIDLSVTAAKEIDLIRAGVAKIKLQVIENGGVLENGYPQPQQELQPAVMRPLPAAACIRLVSEVRVPDSVCKFQPGGMYNAEGARVILENRAWSVQTGIFNNPADAEFMAQVMRHAGITAVFIMAEKEDALTVRYRVLAGLYGSAKEAGADVPFFMEKGLPSDVFPMLFPLTGQAG